MENLRKFDVNSRAALMIMKTKYGFITLLDALGTKTNSIESSKQYLKTVGEIEENIRLSHKAAFDPKSEKRERLKVVDALSIRFFGDTLLLAHEIQARNLEYEIFD